MLLRFTKSDDDNVVSYKAYKIHNDLDNTIPIAADNIKPYVPKDVHAIEKSAINPPAEQEFIPEEKQIINKTKREDNKDTIMTLYGLGEKWNLLPKEQRNFTMAFKIMSSSPLNVSLDSKQTRRYFPHYMTQINKS